MATIRLGFVGDLLIDRPDPASATALVRPVLDELDVVFGNCEAAYSADPRPAPNATLPIFPDVKNVTGLDGFDVLSLANNHSMDAGHDGLLETASRLHELGILTAGAGGDVESAHRPALLNWRGMTVAVQAYASAFAPGWEARPGWPGIAPVRADNLYRPLYPNLWSPGTPPVVVTVPHPDDMEALAADLERARAAADVVVASFHWGDFSRPLVLTDHELRTARFAVDHGADVVVGHHHHLLRGVEWYRDKPIFYGLGHFVFDMSDPSWRLPTPVGAGALDYGIFPREGWPLLHMHPDARMTALAWVDVGPAGLEAAGLLPCRLNQQGQVFPVDPESPEGAEIRDYVARSCALAGLRTALVPDPDRAVAGHVPFRMRKDTE